MPHLTLSEQPELHEPTFLAAFRGWNDGSESATLALSHLIETWAAKPFAEIDPEEFYDFTVARPMIRVTEEGLRDLRWPSNRFYYHRAEEGDYVLLMGTEPHLRWRTFTETVRELYERLGGARLVTLGALVAATLHNRPPPITGFATEEKLQQGLVELGVARGRYEGPTGIVGTMHDAWRRAGLPSASLWVAVPAYVGNATNPSAALGLLRALERLLDVRLDVGGLPEAAAAFVEQVDQALAANDELRAYLVELEQRLDADDGGEPRELPSPGEVIGDLEEFLREQRKDE